MNKPLRNLPTAPNPDAIQACETCIFRDGNNDTFFTPVQIFAMDLSQSVLPAEERIGVNVTRVGLSSKRDIELNDPRTGEAVVRQGVVLPVACGALSGIEMDPEAWEAIRATGCMGPEEGRKRYILGGRRLSKCGLFRILQEQSNK